MEKFNPIQETFVYELMKMNFWLFSDSKHQTLSFSSTCKFYPLNKFGINVDEKKFFKFL